MSEVPEEYKEAFEQYRQTMIEKIVETDEKLLIRYLEGEQIEEESLRNALRQATITGDVVPVLCGSAPSGKGVHPLLDAIVDYLPSPKDIPAVEGVEPRSGNTELRFADEQGPLSALAFKVATDPYVGRLVFLRIYSGKVESGASVLNVTKGNRERMGRLLQMHANHREELEELGAGNICATVGLKNTFTGDTICGTSQQVLLEPPQFPDPVVSVAIEPMSRLDQDRLAEALRKLAEEDPTFVIRFDDETGQTVISGMGELHLDVLVDRMRREFHVEANVGPAESVLPGGLDQAGEDRRTVRAPNGGHGQFGHVWLELEPLERGSGIVFEASVPGGRVPREYFSAVEKGVRDALQNGPLAGYNIVDLKVSLVDGSYHPVDSSEMAFRSAGMLAIRKALPRANRYCWSR